jgi:hypothetical protein
VTRPDGKRAGVAYTTAVLAAAAFSLALVVDQALVVAAGRHLVARIDAWLAALQPAAEMANRGSVASMRSHDTVTPRKGPADDPGSTGQADARSPSAWPPSTAGAHAEEPSDSPPETPDL